jgi:hypothetical protein
MNARIFALLTFVLGLLVASYLCWAWHRLTGSVLMADGHLWPRPWPYPDVWLYHWEQQLDAARPTPPGTLKIHGEFALLQFYLSCWIGLSLIVSFGAFIWLMILKKRDRDA